MRSWFILLALALLSDMLASVVISWQFWSMRNGRQTNLVRLLALVFFALFIRGLFELCAVASGFKVAPVFTTGYAIFYWSGRAVVAVAVWWLLWGIIHNPGLPAQQEPPS